MLPTLFGVLLAVAAAECNPAADSSAVYDQRQIGKTNVRVEVKDAVVISVGDAGEHGGDYDYSYDYSDLTIKPPQAPSSTKDPPTWTQFTVTTRPTTTMGGPSTTKQTSSPTRTTTTTTTTTYQPSMKSTMSPAVFNASKSPILLEAENNSIIFPPKNPDSGPLDPIKMPPSQRPDQIPVLVLQELLGSLPYKFLPHSVKTSQSSSTHASPINPETLPRRNCSPGYFLDSHNRCKKIVPKPGIQVLVVVMPEAIECRCLKVDGNDPGKTTTNFPFVNILV